MTKRPNIIILNQDDNPDTKYYWKLTDFIDFFKLGYRIVDDKGKSRKTVSRTVRNRCYCRYNDINIALSKFIYDFYNMLITQYDVDANNVIDKNFYGWNLTVGDNYFSAAYKDIYETKVEISKEDEYADAYDISQIDYITASNMTDGLIFAQWILNLVRNDNENITDEWLRKFSMELWHRLFTKPSEEVRRINWFKANR